MGVKLQRGGGVKRVESCACFWYEPKLLVGENMLVNGNLL